MLKKLKTKDQIDGVNSISAYRQQGFTIIEVLIVLAIAGLILLIVFLAVPALQRNARNTSRKNDVSRELGAVQEVINNNNGQVNTTVLTTAAILTAAGSLGYYTAGPTVAAAPTSATNGDTVDTTHVYIGATCAAMANGGGYGATSAGATAREVAITYMLEPSGNTSRQCTGS